MYVFSTSGRPMKCVCKTTYRFERSASLTSDYVTPLSAKNNYVHKYKPRKKDLFKDRWQNDFYFIAKDFGFEPKTIIDIIYDVITSAKPDDKIENLYIRSMNKLYDMI